MKRGLTGWLAVSMCTSWLPTFIGINVRYLGVIYHIVKRSMVRKSVFREMCVRVIKNALRQRLRQVPLFYWGGDGRRVYTDQGVLSDLPHSARLLQQMRLLGATIAEEPYRVLVMEFLNMVLGRVQGPPSKEGTSAHFWHVELRKSIIIDFMVIIHSLLFSSASF